MQIPVWLVMKMMILRYAFKFYCDNDNINNLSNFQFDDLSHKSSANSLNQSVNNSGNTKVPSVTENVSKNEEEMLRKNSTGALVPTKPPRAEQKTQQDEWDLKLYGKPPKGTSLNF